LSSLIWTIGALAQAPRTLDLRQSEQPVLGRFSLFHPALPARREDVVGTAQHARGGPAHLDVEAADRREVEHGVEGRDLEHSDVGHAELLPDELHHRDRQPALSIGLRPDLPLREVQQRDHRRGLPSLG
jgi:hypothetical protein